MNLQKLREYTRIRLDDTEEDYLWSNTFINFHLNEAVEEAATRANLLDEHNHAEFNIAVDQTSQQYELNDKIIIITGICWESTGKPLAKNEWQTTERYLFLKDKPQTTDNLLISCYRTPLETMTDDDDAPEIAERHHYRLIDWVLFRAYSIPDSDQNDEARAQKHEAEFIKSFGIRQDNNVLRKHKSNGDHVVKYNDFS